MNSPKTNAATGPGGEKKAELKSLLQKLKAGHVSPETKAKAKAFFASVDAQTIGLLEQELIQEGISHDEVRASLCDIHLDVMKDSLLEQRKSVAAPHPIHTLMEEHRCSSRTTCAGWPGSWRS